MARASNEERVSMREAAKRLGMTEAAIGQWAAKPGAPALLIKGRRWAKWPDFPIWYRQELRRNREKPTDLDDAKKRKMAAEAELAEIELAKARADAVSLADVEQTLTRAFSGVRGRLQSLTGRLAPLVVGAKTVADSTRLIEPVVHEVMEELAR